MNLLKYVSRGELNDLNELDTHTSSPLLPFKRPSSAVVKGDISIFFLNVPATKMEDKLL